MASFGWNSGFRPFTDQSPPRMGDTLTNIEDRIAQGLSVTNITADDLIEGNAFVEISLSTAALTAGWGNHGYVVTGGDAGFYSHNGSEWFRRGAPNVKDFGARGDGSTDDTAAIEDAIDSGTRALYFPAGTYIVNPSVGTQAIAPASNMVIFGDGAGATIIKISDSSTDAHAISLKNVSNVTIRDLQIDGNKANASETANGPHGIRIEGCTDIRIENVYIHDTLHYGIGIEDTTSTATTSYRVFISNCYIKDTDGDGIDIKGQESTPGTGYMITNCIIENPGSGVTNDQGGIDVRGSATISNCQVLGLDSDGTTQHGIRVRRSSSGVAPQGSKIVISGCTVRGASSDMTGIAVSGTKTSVTGCVVEATGSSSSQFGIDIDAANEAVSGVSVTGCQISGGKKGIRIRESVSRACIVGNEIEDVDQGIDMESVDSGGPVDCIIASNLISAVTTGIRVDGDTASSGQNSINGNHLMDMTTGVNITGINAVNNAVLNNTYHNCTNNLLDSGTTTKVDDAGAAGTVGGLDID